MKSIAVQISGELMEEAKLFAKVEDRSITKQIEHWIKLGKCAEEIQTYHYLSLRKLQWGLNN